MLLATVNASIVMISLPAIFNGIQLDPLAEADEPVALQGGVQRTGIHVSVEQERPEGAGARCILLEQPCGGAATAQRVIDDVADRGAVTGAGETMRQAPILQRIRRRPVPPVDIVQYFDRCRKSAAKAHIRS